MINSAQITLAIVSPCFNEADVLPLSIPRLLSLLDEFIELHQCSKESFVVLIDDGSRDATWELIASAAAANPRRLRGIKLSCNVGHQYALVAGLTYVTGICDAAISIDVDLQDDLSALPRMLAEFREGAEIVLGVKESRSVDPFLKKLSASLYYKGMRWMGADLVENHADCRLMSARALRNLSLFPEHTLFLRGLQPLIHARIATVRYSLSPRPAGESKYPLHKMLALAWNGITSFSTFPLRLISATGAIIFAVSLVFALVALGNALAGETVPGWASITVPLYLLGGGIILSVGIVGEYVAKIFLEVKQRPRFIVDRIAGDDS